jgi:hypothetical protein
MATLLRDRLFGREEFLRWLGVTGTTFDWKLFQREFTLGLGCPTTAVVNQYLSVDAIAVLLCSMLSGLLGLKPKVAATVVREAWDLWLVLAETAESRPDIERYLAVGMLPDRPLKVAAGSMADCEAHLRGYPFVRRMPIQLVLHQLRINADTYKVDNLPDRFTPSPIDWREIEAYRKVAILRFKARTGTSGRTSTAATFPRSGGVIVNYETGTKKSPGKALA